MNHANVKNESEAPPSFLALPDGRRIAYHLTEGALPGVIFMGGFKSDMTGAKALALEAFCKRRGQRFLRFDYTGHGRSSGDFRDGTIGGWRQDALDVIDQLGASHNILVGSSMGGWLMLLAALARPGKLAGLVGIASAPDFTEKLIWEQFSPQQKQVLAEKGEVLLPSCYGEEPYPITRRLIEEGRRHLLLGAPVAIALPVRLIHGMRDEDVPWEFSSRLAETLQTDDVELCFIKDGGHRLSDEKHLDILKKTVEELLA
ncbi:MAG: alpha/beta fold hydrolase [Alphaproteobacteria bacterium]|nr:alpha/beta fold hydrolase [Alphaproteobacteria bacterium]